MASVPDEMPHPHAPTPNPPPPPPVPELPPYAPVDPQKTPLRPDLGSPPPYASVVQETYTNNGYQGEGRCQGQCQGQSQGQGQSQSQPQCRVHYHRGPPFHRCHVHHHHHRSPSGAGLSEAMQELVVDHGLSTSFGQYNQCSLNDMAAPMRYPQHVTIIRDSQVGAEINTHCLIGFATFVLCCCCVPFGMAAMMKALEVRTRLQTGDIVGARTAASSSRMWAGSGLLIGAVFELSLIIYILYI
ncbi:uncharacterized protein LOC115928148 [Strongylocentrotus purpuratus]|uniref:Uncharacterized protein n=1 Tax=Strongylocentrotus purpuratus TaxID=7668 RepID=A0A7M7T3C5_STRPU|nr:uncharacterized protein LOC115928148 [Strongylocentrotus purpuratus]